MATSWFLFFSILLMFEKKNALLISFLAGSRPTFDPRYNEIVDYLQYKEIKMNKVRISAWRPQKLIWCEKLQRQGSLPICI